MHHNTHTHTHTHTRARTYFFGVGEVEQLDVDGVTHCVYMCV
jgi:hypothetical protein